MRTWLLVACAVLSTSAFAAKSKSKTRSPAKKEEPAAVAPAPKAVAPPAAAPSRPKTEFKDPSTELLKQAQALYSELEYDKVIPLAETILKRDDLPVEQKIETYRLYASSLVIVQDPLEGARLFRLLVRTQPEYELPPGTPIKINQVFLQVRNEELALARQAERFQRDNLIKNLKLLGEPPDSAKGGRPLPFSFRLRDLSNAVEAIQVGYRRAGTPAYSSLALLRDDEGTWRGQIPGEFTASETGFKLEYYVETKDAKGTLLTVGNATMPVGLSVSPGSSITAAPPPLPRWAFVSGATATAIAGISAGVFGVMFNAEQSRHNQLTGEVQGADVVARINRGNTLAAATNVSLIVTGATALVTGILVPFTDWDAP
jgi:hypothetical protein